MFTVLFDLTFRSIIGNLPHDAGAVVVFVVLALFGVFVWHGSRQNPNARPTDRSGSKKGKGPPPRSRKP